MENQNFQEQNQPNNYNEFNNSNPETTNFSNNMTQYNQANNYPVFNTEENKPPKSNGVLIAILLVIIIALAGYIIYDKVTVEKDVNNQNDVNNNENNNENNQTNNNDENESNQNNNTEGKNIVFEKNINGKNIKVEYKISVSDKKDPWIICDLFINGSKEDNWKKDLYPAGADGFSEEEINSDINDFIETINSNFASNVGIVKGDKDYLYVLSGGYAPNKLLILNENAEIITTEDIIPNDVNAYLNPGQNCQKYESYNNKSYFIDNDAIYYLMPSTYNSDYSETYANEYKLTFANNQVNKEKISTCESEIGGDKDLIFEDMEPGA